MIPQDLKKMDFSCNEKSSGSALPCASIGTMWNSMRVAPVSALSAGARKLSVNICVAVGPISSGKPMPPTLRSSIPVAVMTSLRGLSCVFMICKR